MEKAHISINVLFEDKDGYLMSFARNKKMSIDEAIDFLEGVRTKVRDNKKN